MRDVGNTPDCSYRLDLCAPSVRLSAASGHKVSLTPALGVALRVLALWPDAEYISYETLANWQRNDDGNNIKWTSVKSTIQRLGKRLGDGAIETAAEGRQCRLNRNVFSIDCIAVSSRRSNLVDRWYAMKDEPGEHEDLITLFKEFQEEHACSPENPATGFSRATGGWGTPPPDRDAYETACQIMDQWTDSTDEFMIAFAEITFATGVDDNYRPAQKTLMAMCERDTPPLKAWELLLNHLRERQSRDLVTWVDRYLDWCDKTHEGVNFATEAERSAWQDRRSLPPGTGLTDEDLRLVQIGRTLGLVPLEHTAMTETGMLPEQLISRQPKRLLFAGTLASKWVESANVRRMFDRYLASLDTRTAAQTYRQVDSRAPVRFIIMYPYGESYQRLGESRLGNISRNHISHLVELDRGHRSFAIRTIDAVPRFRLQCIDYGDQAIASFSRYPLTYADYEAEDSGYRSPHFLVRWQTEDDLLGQLVKNYFEAMWNGATPLVVPSEEEE